ncbi:hypothetical protein B0H67DRAFT_486953 [Lasiosphaeris hirsuta]|uniref:Uncharacterized protein n=1 Tax=Lasiosphaeris hirsuta TaxID=260670 RepID=A0AA40AQ53_9PEZI|nr:hypothetical protein B0H67DRAFT_486953 [Lasiosphaeris hirsuta]
MRILVPRIAVAASISARLVAALIVSPGSPCSTSCGNVLGSTSPDEMVCDAASYSGKSAGIVFENCIKCETTSTYSSGTQTDTQWLLYNLRFNLGFCLWGDLGNTNAGSNPCLTSMACEPLKDAVSFGNYTKSLGPYDYCRGWDPENVEKCTTCLVRLPDGYFLSNYVTMLDAGCQQKPGINSTISIQGNPFETIPVVITAPTPTYASVPSPDYGPVSLGARVGIAFGGLAFILAIVGCCIVCNGKRRRRAFLRDLERRHGGPGWPHPKSRFGSGGDMLETPASQKPLRNWDESPISAITEATERTTPLPRYFSPYNSQYNSPVSATDGPGAVSSVNWPALSPQQIDQLMQDQSPAYGSSAHGSPAHAFTQWPSPTQEKLYQQQMHHEKRQNEIAIGLALGGDEASLRSKGSNPSISNNPYAVEGKGKNRDEVYEMHEVESPYNGSNSGEPSGYHHHQQKLPAEPVAPVLHHPGYGRQNSRPGTGGTTASGGKGARIQGLTERDMRNGNAL